MYLHKIFINRKRNNIYFVYKTNNSIQPYTIYSTEKKSFFYLDINDALNYNILIPATILTTFYNKEKASKIRLFRFRNKYYVQTLNCFTTNMETISLSKKQYNYIYYQLDGKNYNKQCRISNEWDKWTISGLLKEF